MNKRGEIFTHVKGITPPRNKFDMSFENLMSTDVGPLRPMACYEIIPGDHFRVRTECFARLLPMDKPAFAMLDIYMYWYFVPNRIIWDGFTDYITTGLKGTASPVIPTIEWNQDTSQQGFEVGSLADYFGFPAGAVFPENGDPVNIISLPFRAYQCIYENFFMDQNLFTPREWSHGNGAETSQDAAYLLTTRNLCWTKDMFTSALPWAQKGGDVPLGDDGVVVVNQKRADNHPGLFRKVGGDLYPSTQTMGQDGSGNIPGGEIGGLYSGGANAVQGYYDPNGTLKVNMPSIEMLRNNMRLQEWLELHARGGTRYAETLWSEWKVRSSDASLQRPQFLGGGKQPFIISEVLNHSGVTVDEGLGSYAGKGISAGSKCYMDHFFEEHGWLIGLIGVRPKSLYADGLPKMFTRYDILDWPFPSFAHLGEQPIYNREVFLAGNETKDTGVFGYTPRYAELKWKGSEIHGLFRDSLDTWHLARIFQDTPGLNNSFMMVTPEDADRIFPVSYDVGGDRILVDLWHDARALRNLPKFGTPRL